MPTVTSDGDLPSNEWPLGASQIRYANTARPMSRFLTSKELVELTGAKTRKAQARHLDKKGYIYEINRLGHIRLLWTHVEAKLGGSVSARSVERPSEPDYAFFDTTRVR